jgi:threonine dehydrogenase-like Zn-dependent dehydrogenase
MKQAFFPALHEMPVVKDGPIPECGDGEMLVKVKMASICNLTDTHTIEGLHPPHDQWITHFETPPGAFPAPVGHEGAVEILEIGCGVEGFEVGDRAFTVRASEMMAEYAVILPGDATKIPDHISWAEAAPMEMLHCTFPLIDQTVSPGISVAILGQGASGLMATQCVRLAGARQIIVTEPEGFKRELALKLGATAALDPHQVDVVEAVRDLTDGQGVDTVIECVGLPETISMTVDLLRRRSATSTSLNIGVFGACKEHVPFDFFKLHWKGGCVYTASSTRLGYSAATRQRCVDLMASGLFDMKPLITHKFPLSKLPLAFDMIMHNRDPYVKVVIDPEWEEADDAGGGPEAYRIYDEYR